MVNLLQQDSPEADQSSESITDQTNEVHEQPPPHKRKKIHPLKKLLGDKFGAPSGISTAGSASLEDQAQAELA